MNTNFGIYKYEFLNRKPSKVQINSCIKNAIKSNSKAFTIIWGENQIDLEYNSSQKMWYGNGHIKNISGWDLAIELNDKETRNTLNLWNS